MSATTAPAAKPRARDSLKKVAFWNFGGLFFFYFAIWQLAFTFLPLWLKHEGMTPGPIGVVGTVQAVTALLLQPFYGLLQDRLGFRKNLFYFVVICGALIGPFFKFVFLPLIDVNQVLAAVVGGVFLSLCLNSGVGVVEAFNERNARANSFEYGHIRLFGSIAGGTMSLVGGFIWAANPESIWWAGSLSAVVLGALLFLARTPRPGEPGALAAGVVEDEASKPRVTKESIRALLSNRSFVGFCVLMFGTAAIYDVFDAQFPNYFVEMIGGNADVLFTRVVSIQIFAEAAFMVAAPFIVNKIGARNGLIVFAVVLIIRVLGSAFITSPEMLIVWRLLAAIEMPFMLVSVMKYITRMFDVRISATAYMLGFNMSKQIGVALFSTVFGYSYEAIGFPHSYVVMAVVVAAVTIVAVVLMRDDRPHGVRANLPSSVSVVVQP